MGKVRQTRCSALD